MIIYAEYSPEDIFKIEEINSPKDKTRVKFDTINGSFNVKINSPRLQCFKNNHSCVACGIKGIVFRLENHTSNRDGTPHLNLYGKKDDQFILMTKDHIKPKSLGGGDKLHNLQTMCHACNEAKGNHYEVAKTG
jgi:5-methylcytosine-specific restriction endonuclease McrA